MQLANHNHKGIISLLLCIVVCAAFLPISAYSDDAMDYTDEELVLNTIVYEESVLKDVVDVEEIPMEVSQQSHIDEPSSDEEPFAENNTEDFSNDNSAMEEISSDIFEPEEPIAGIYGENVSASAVFPEEDLYSDSPAPISLVLDADLPDNLLNRYAEQQINSQLSRLNDSFRASNKVGERLEGAPWILYSEQKKAISQIAAGQLESTEITTPLETLFEGKLKWTAEELGVDAIVVDGKINSTPIWNALYSMVDVRSVLTALLSDCPYELYWYDKTVGISYGFDTGLSTVDARTAVQISGGFFIRYTVSSDYSAGPDYTVDTALGQQVQHAVNNAKEIVSRSAGCSTFEKLDHYRQEICDRVSYNYSAAGGGADYGNPWQLIWVFDDDISTNVVCEGYAKAFQYLCDLSDISGVFCYTVSGHMTAGIGAGRHMWNVIAMPDQKNYLVDITNCDYGSTGYPDKLFLKGYDTKDGFTYYSYSGVTYEYDDITLNTFTEADLTLSDTDYAAQVAAVIELECVSGGLPSLEVSDEASFLTGESYHAAYEIRNNGNAIFDGTVFYSVSWEDDSSATDNHDYVKQTQSLTIAAGGCATVSLNFSITDISGNISWGIFVYDTEYSCVAEDMCITPIPVKQIPDTAELIIEPASLSIPAGTSWMLTVSGTESPLIWESENSEIATVDQNGEVTGICAGHTTISVQTADNTLDASCQVSVQFADVSDDSRYYYNPVYWALDNRITTGTSPTTFSPNDNCTREQIVTFLWRMSGEPEPGTYAVFDDVSSDKWYYKPVSWAAENGITTGYAGSNRFGVGDPCTREQCVTFLWRAAGKPASNGENNFTDMAAGAYYVDAVTWAAAKGITIGLNDGTGRFGVGQTCNRAMIATFLLRFSLQ